MPAASISSIVSDSAYLAAVLIVTVLLFRPVFGLYSDSEQQTATMTATSLSAVVNAMSPGMSTTVLLQGPAFSNMSVSFTGTEVVVACQGHTASQAVIWQLRPAHLYAGRTYTLRLDRDVVVEESGVR